MVACGVWRVACGVWHCSECLFCVLSCGWLFTALLSCDALPQPFVLVVDTVTHGAAHAYVLTL